MANLVYIVSIYRSAKTQNPTYHLFWAEPELLQQTIKQEDALMRKQVALDDCIDTQVFNTCEESMNFITDLYRFYNCQIGCF